MATWPQKVGLFLTSLGRGLAKNSATNLVDVAVSANAGNLVQFGTDNGLFVPSTSSTGSNTTLPAASAANQGSNLVVDANGNWVINPLAGPILNWPALV